ncbi:hypothetical protein BCV72DRAFT_184262, partial [Rhizopus microsporus var. microsporus]
VDIQQVKKLENGSCYTRVILLARKIRTQIDKIKRQKGYNMPKIQQAQKKRNGLKGILTRTYHVGSLLFTQTLVSKRTSGFYVCRDMLNGERRDVLKLFMTTSQYDHLVPIYGFTFCLQKLTQREKEKDRKLREIRNTTVRSALMFWSERTTSTYFPPVSLAIDILRVDGIKIYIVY